MIIKRCMDKVVKSSDGSLEAQFDEQGIIISSPRAPSIRIRLVDHTSSYQNHPEGIYLITSFNPRLNEELNDGDTYCVYVGARGVLLGDATTERYRDALNYTLADKNVDGILLIVLYQTPLVTTEIVEVITEAHNTSKKPIIVISTGGEFTELLSRSLMERGIAVFNFPTETVNALDKVVAYQTKHKHIKSEKEKSHIVKPVKNSKVKKTSKPKKKTRKNIR